MDDINNASSLKKLILILSHIPSAIVMFVFSLFPPSKIISKSANVYTLDSDGHKTEAASMGISLLEQLLKDKSKWQLKSQNNEVYYQLFEISIRNSIDTFNKKNLETIDNLCEIWYLQKDISKRSIRDLKYLRYICQMVQNYQKDTDAASHSVLEQRIAEIKSRLETAMGKENIDEGNAGLSAIITTLFLKVVCFLSPGTVLGGLEGLAFRQRDNEKFKDAVITCKKGMEQILINKRFRSPFFFHHLAFSTFAQTGFYCAFKDHDDKSYYEMENMCNKWYLTFEDELKRNFKDINKLFGMLQQLFKVVDHDISDKWEKRHV